ncbi:MAG TPA: helix-turn-helix domain-containing protein [Pseudonocardiaceae bacterium]|jgi:AcrR family transcriptional regulator|nr:helix-turn-helix domain-containing protein [Pseudonocardiaceae bacterium]
MIKTSFLLNEVLREPETDEVTVRIMDAALAEYLAHGLRRTSVDDVARAAGLGRATVYRRFATRDELVQAVLVREGRRYFAELAAATESLPSLADRLVEGFVVGVRNARRQPLLSRLISTETRDALPQLTVDGGPLFAVLREFLVHQYLTSAEGAGQTHGKRPQQVAEVIVRLGVSLVLTPQSSLPLEDDEAMREFARTFLAPMLSC